MSVTNWESKNVDFDENSPEYKEMMGFLGAGNNPMVGMTVAVAVAVAESQK